MASTLMAHLHTWTENENERVLLHVLTRGWVPCQCQEEFDNEGGVDIRHEFHRNAYFLPKISLDIYNKHKLPITLEKIKICSVFHIAKVRKIARR
jgi:hypothetical protein